MIELRNVAVRTRGTLNPVSLKNVNLRIEDRERLAILGPPNGATNLVTTVLCEANAPDAGRVIRTSRISWPIPSSTFLHKHQSFIANARFIARLYEADQKTFIPEVLDLAGVGDLAEQPLNRCPKAMVSRFVFALGMRLPFDFYLFTKTTAGERKDREKFEGLVEEAGTRAGIIVASTNAKAAQAFCDRAFVLDPAGCVSYDDFEAAAEHLARISKGVAVRPEEGVEEDEEEERGLSDFF